MVNLGSTVCIRSSDVFHRSVLHGIQINPYQYGY